MNDNSSVYSRESRSRRKKREAVIRTMERAYAAPQFPKRVQTANGVRRKQLSPLWHLVLRAGLRRGRTFVLANVRSAPNGVVKIGAVAIGSDACFSTTLDAVAALKLIPADLQDDYLRTYVTDATMRPVSSVFATCLLEALRFDDGAFSLVAPPRGAHTPFRWLQ